MTDARPWQVLEGDCAVTLAGLPAESVDACVTDTPYGLSTLLDPPNLDREALWSKLTSGTQEAPIRTLLRAWLDTGDNPVMKGRGFMGKAWDALVPSPNTWRAVWRVLKPGAYCFAFGGTRTADLVAMSLRLADFEVEDTIAWLQSQGFPKRVRLDLKIDQHFGKAGERPVVGSKLGLPGYHLNPHNGGATYGDGVGRTTAEQRLKASQEFGPATPDAARFVGWDRAIRPGFEPVIVAVKPLRGTVAENALRYGTGGLHVDACRLPRGDKAEFPEGVISRTERVYGEGAGAYGDRPRPGDPCPTGGYPANVAMDEETAAALDEMSGDSKARLPARRGGDTSLVFEGPAGAMGYRGRPDEIIGYGDSGGASRFFYVAKASSSERDAGLEDLPPLTAGGRCDREDGTAGVNGYAGTRGEGGRCSHPTVKPIALMRWLCRLAAPPGAHDPDMSKRPVILDPFFGSGSTGVAALAEGLRVIGCEMMPEYVEIARRRCQHAYALPPDDPEAPKRRSDTAGQKTLF